MLAKLRRIAVVALATAAPIAHAQDDEPLDREPVTCIVLGRIDSTKVVDRQTILFFMKGDRVYRNTLLQTCPNLDRRSSVSYQTTSTRMGRLCERELVQTDDGTNCRLGPFVPVTREEADDLLAGDAHAGEEASSIDVSPTPPNDPPANERRRE